MSDKQLEKLRRVKELVGKGYGRRRIAKDLGITEWETRALMNAVIPIQESTRREKLSIQIKDSNRVRTNEAGPTNTSVRLVNSTYQTDVPTARAQHDISLKVACISDCVPVDSEVLTINGWRKIVDVNVGEEIMASDKDANLYLSPILHKVEPKLDDVYDFLRGSMRFQFTEKHRHLYFTGNKHSGFATKTTFDLKNHSTVGLKASGYKIDGKNEKSSIMRLLGFCIGDGTRDSENWKILVSKTRKIAYLDSIFDPDSMTKNLNNNYVIYRLRVGLTKVIDSYFLNSKKKTINWEAFIRLNKSSLEDIWDGIVNSDGSKRVDRPSILLSSVKEEHVYLYQTINHLIGRQCSYSIPRSNLGSSFPSDKPLYGCTSYKNKSGIYQGIFQKDSSKKLVTCLTVKGSYFLLKQNNNIIITGNCHFPYEDKRAESVAFAFMVDYQPDILVWNGDIWDMYYASQYEKNVKKKMNIQEEIDYGYDRVKFWTKNLNKTKHYFVTGNHDLRLSRTIAKNVPALASLRSLELQKNIDFDALDMTYVPAHQDLYIGDLLFTHGTHIRKDSGSSAKAHFDQFGCSVLIGHVHRLGVTYKRTKGATHVMVENGTLSDFDVEYTPFPNWQHGFSCIEYDGPKFSVAQHHIIDHRLIANGKVYCG